MRGLILIAGALALTLPLGACGKKDQAGETSNIDDNVTADSIVSNDVTAIDAVTGDAANMAADSNIGEIAPENELDIGNSTAPKPAAKKPAAKKPVTPAPTTTAPDTAGNAAD